MTTSQLSGYETVAADTAPRPALRWLGGGLRAARSSRLVQFMGLGALLFAIAPPVDDEFQTPIRGDKIDALVAKQAARAPGGAVSTDDQTALRSRLVENEVLLAEARRLGLDQSDEIVQNRLIQKLLFIAEDLRGASRDVTEADKRAHYEAHKDQYQRPASVELVHVFARDRAELQRLRPDVVRLKGEAGQAPPMGEPFVLPRRASANFTELTTRYGKSFASEVGRLPIGTWSEPIASKYGFHLVRIDARSELRVADYSEVKGRLALDVVLARREAAASEYVAALMDRYEVTVDGEPLSGYQPQPRRAVHVAPSADD